MPGILYDGFNLLVRYYLPALEFFVGVLGCGLFVMRRIVGRDRASTGRWLIAPGVGLAVLSLLAFLLVVVGHLVPSVLLPGAMLILALAALVLLQEIWLARRTIRRKWYLVAGGAVVVSLLLMLRLAFLNGVIMPPYSDSPVHYQIVVSFLHPALSSTSVLSLDSIFRDYYHFGFQSLAAWLSLVGSLAPEQAILLVGQLLLVVCPISIYALTYTVTRSHAGAAFAGLLAALAWYMPAYGVNWGKFPALSSLAVLPAVVAAFLLAAQTETKRTTLLLWGGIVLLSAALLHTRILFCLLFGAAGAFLAWKINLESSMSYWRALLFSLFFLLSLLPLHGTLQDYYRGLTVLVAFLVLLPFAFQEYPKLSTAVFFFIFFLWLAITIPFPGPQTGQTLLDPPYLEMALYIPLSVVAGAGFAALMHRLPYAGWQRPLVATLLALMVLLNIAPRSMRPDSCCSYFNQDDQSAFQWVRQQTMPRSLFLVSSYAAGNATVGTDAGLWIKPLTGRSVEQLPYNVDWQSPVVFERVCRLTANPIYVYRGGKQFSFPMDAASQPVRLEPAFRSGGTAIYRVLGCPQHQ